MVWIDIPASTVMLVRCKDSDAHKLNEWKYLANACALLFPCPMLIAVVESTWHRVCDAASRVVLQSLLEGDLASSVD